MEKIILDTDIGSDIDDALCLAYLLKNRECDLIGITTVSGEAEKRAMLASVVCTEAGRDDIPIYPGAEKPLLSPQLQPAAKQAEALPRWKHGESFPRHQAVDFIRSTVRRYPGEVTLLGVGPMTNLALLFSVDPEIPSLLKQLVLMCGIFAYKTPQYVCLSEWNARCDPHATAVVYKTPGIRIKSVGLDVTTRVTMDRKTFRASCTADIMKPVLDFSELWFDDASTITFHDPLAASAIFSDSFLRFTPGDIEVITDGQLVSGLTHWKANPDSIQSAAFEVDSDKFLRHYFATVNQT